MKVMRVVSPDQELCQFARDVERSLLLYLIVTMRHKELSAAKAKHLMKTFLTLTPFVDKEDLLHKLYSLSINSREAGLVFLKYGIPFYEDKRKRTIERVRSDFTNEILEKGGETYA